MNVTANMPRAPRAAGIPAGDAACRAWPRARAFTLIELLLAMVIFAVVLSAISGVLYSAMRLRTHAADAVEQALPVERALGILRRDLAGIVLPTGVVRSNLQVNAGSGDGAVAETDMAIYTATGRMSDDLPWGEVQRVAYGLRAPTNNFGTYGKDLVRLVYRNPLAPLQDEAEEQRLLGGVDRIEFAFWDGTTWQNQWNATNQDAMLPGAVKAMVTLAEDPRRRVATAARPMPYQVIVPLLVSGTNATTTASSGTSTGGQP